MAKIIMYTTRWCGDCRQAKRFLNEHHISYEEIDIEQHEGAAEHMMKINGGKRNIPTFDIDGHVFVLATYNEQRLRKELGLMEEVQQA